MGFRLGIDFGTTFTKIAYIMADGDPLQFPYPELQGPGYIPTAVCYQNVESGTTTLIGSAARLSAGNRGLDLFDNFKMSLPWNSREEWMKRGWRATGPTPAEVTADYLRQLLLCDPDSFNHALGEIESVVVSVPEIWQHSAANYGAATLLTIVRDQLQLPVDRLQSEPVCAAAYFGWKYGRSSPLKGTPFNLLVCDLGGGTFDVAVCRVSGSTITVLDFDGTADMAGVYFDNAAVRMAMRRKGVPESDEQLYRDLMTDFEKEKIVQSGPFRRAFEKVKNVTEASDKVIYSVQKGAYEWSLKDVREAFKPVGDSIHEVLKRLLGRVAVRGDRIDAFALVGAPSVFPLVEDLMKDELGKMKLDYLTVKPEDRGYAVSRGAALIAAGRVETVEFYPNELGIEVLNAAVELGKQTLTVVKARELRAGQLSPVFMRNEKTGKRYDVKVMAEGPHELPVKIRIGGEGKWYVFKTRMIDLPPPGHYHVGILVDQSNLGMLVFRPLEGPQDGSLDMGYPLGNLETKLVVEDH